MTDDADNPVGTQFNFAANRLGLLLVVPRFFVPAVVQAQFSYETNQFGFRVSWATNRTTVIEACTNIAAASWVSTGNQRPEFISRLDLFRRFPSGRIIRTAFTECDSSDK